MGEKEAVKNDGEKKAAAAAGGEKKADDGNVTVVLKMDLHCEGCAQKVKRAIKNFGGVDKVTADCASNKVTVTGKVDPSAVREKLEQKTKKKVELVSPQPQPAAKKDEKPPEKKAEDKKPAADNKPKQSTVVLAIRLHCDGCISKIRKAIAKTKGVESVDIDKNKNLVTVKGTMDPKELAPALTKKFNRPVDVVAPKPAAGPAPAPAPAADKKPEAGDKKDKKPEEGEKKPADAKPAAAAAPAPAAAAPAAKVEVNKMEYNYGQAMGMYWPAYDGPISAHNRYVMEAHAHQAFVNQNYANHVQGYANPQQGYAVPMDHYNHPQMFSDENPNACTVM